MGGDCRLRSIFLRGAAAFFPNFISATRILEITLNDSKKKQHA
jgi:hypothetical protein